MNATTEGYCKLCNRFATTLSEHHMIPRTTHRNKRVEKMFSKDEMNHKEDFCQPCHKAVHTFFSEKELALEHNTVEKLRQSSAVQNHIRWVRKQRPDLRMKGKRMGQKEKQW
jgi:hypothetical protein